MFAKRVWLFFFLIVAGSRLFSQANSPLQPAVLTCEYLKDPLGIDAQHPRLSWTFNASARNQFQSAYEIIVSDDAEDVQKNKGNVWSTGKIISAKNINVEYTGKPLQSFTKYYWRIKVYNQNNEASAWSHVHVFETAMLHESDWKAKWISDGSKNPERDEDYYKDDRMPLFRKEFSANKKIISARLYVSGVGYYEACLNGKKIGDHVLDPGFTTYKKEVLYAVYDISPMITTGKNVAGFMLGNGWYNPLPMRLFGRFDLRKYQQTGRPCVKAEIHIKYADGSSTVITTDETWQTAPGPVIRNNVYLGEKYDARLEQKNWCSLNATTTDWKNAVVTQGPSGVLTAQMQPAIKITSIIQPIKITEPKPDTFIVDMGQNFAGVARIKLKGKAGSKISLRYGEDVYEDGTLNYMTTVATQIKKGGIQGGPGAPETAWQQDDYILKGNGEEVWNPRFTFHGFRYVEITGWPGTLTIKDVEGLRMNADLQSNGTFACSNEMFNQLHKNIQWTFLSNVFSVQSDCPGREKMGYGADMVVTANAFQYNYNMANFYAKAVKDFANEQQPDGGITEIAPFTGIADLGYGGESGPIGWELAFAYLQKQLYDFYGDTRIIKNNYDAFIKQVNFLRSKSKENLFYWGITDHEALDPKPEALAASAFYYHHILLAEEFAEILSKKDDAEKYTALASRIKGAIVKKFLVPATGRFDNATQSAQIFALWYHLTPEKENTYEVMMKEFERHHMHLATGIFSTKMMFDVFRENNDNSVAYTIANQKDFPGWGYMIENGATTLWETWAYPENSPSQNHPMFGSVDEWFYRYLLGINAAAPGFEKIIIKPQPVKELTWAKGSYQSVRGLITSEWSIANGLFNFKVSIPPNTTAEIYIPCKEDSNVMESNKPVKDEKEIKFLRYENGYAVMAIASGDYNFSAPSMY
jgi:alpha-L-rhamnosidase